MNSPKYLEYAEKAQRSSILTEETFQKILENTFVVLRSEKEIHSLNSNTSNEIINEFYSCLLTITSDFVRHNYILQDIQQFLLHSCRIVSSRVEKYLEYYEKNKSYIQFTLLNIGTYLPHLTDVKWKIDYIVKSSMLEESAGPLFRISLIAEKYDNINQCNKAENIYFTCTSQELQDLVYKLKDAERHCKNLTNRIT